jgi:F-type H+-transporting ATPase subunit b
MEINLTLVGQLITFAIVVWFSMHYVWPPLMAKIEERQLLIANGLAAAAQATLDLEKAHQDVKAELDAARAEAQAVVEQAHKRSLALVHDAKLDAHAEGLRMLDVARLEINRETIAAKEALRHQVAGLAVAGAEKILAKEINQAANQQMLDDLIAGQL